MLTSIHFLTTYTCNFQCDHCFLFCGPSARGTFTIGQIRSALEQIKAVGTIDSVCFEGGEPFLFLPLVLEGLTLARSMGLKGGVVTNAYWATSAEDAKLYLRLLKERGLESISLSDDALHYGDPPGAHAQRVQQAAAELDMSAKVLCTASPQVEVSDQDGTSVVKGGVMFRGRAADKLVAGLPLRPWECFAKCSREKLDAPARVHIDCFGHVHLCQGLTIGNIWETPLATLLRDFRPAEHPIIGPLLAGGPAELAGRYDVPHEEGYVDECHLCYRLRQRLMKRFPQCLAPAQVYGSER